MSPAPRNAASRRGMNAGQAAALSRATDGRRQHKDWLNLVEITGPFLTLPVLLETWPTLDPLEREQRAPLRLHHGLWSDDPSAGRDEWIAYLLHDLLEWDDALHLPTGGEDPLLDRLALPVLEHDTTLRPDFILIEPDSDPANDSGDITKSIPLLGMTIPAGNPPTSRLKDGDGWAATPADRMARLLRHHRIELGLVTDGRWWCLVWAPAGGVTATAQFDAVGWNEAAEREVVRAFISLLRRSRFFSVLDDQTLPQLLRKSLGKQEDVTEALGVQVRQAVELLVDAIGRADTRAVERGEPGLDAQGVQASQVYRGAVAVMMRVVFLLFAEERGLLPADNEIYAKAYSAGGLCAELEARAALGTTAELEQSTAAWHRLIALFHAVYGGVDHPEFHLHAYDGSIFDPKAYWWLEGLPAPGTDAESAGYTPLLPINDLTVLHMLQAVQHVTIGTGRNAERRTLTFRTLDVEQIGYVYEGLLSYDGRRAEDTVVGLIGRSGLEDEVLLTYLEQLARPHGIGAGAIGPVDVRGLAKRLAEAHKNSGIGSAAALEKKLAPLSESDRVEAERLLHVVTGDTALVARLLPFFALIRRDLRDLPLVIGAGSLYVTDSATRKNTGTHYTPRFLAEKVVKGALQPLVYAPGPLETADEAAWVLRSSQEILSLKVTDIAMGSAAFLVAACRYLAEKLIDAWVREGHEAATAFRSGALPTVSGMENDTDPVVIKAKRQVIEHCLYGVDINPMAVEMAKLSLWLVSMDPHRPFTFLDDRLVVGDSLLGVTSLDQVEVVHLDANVGHRLHRDRLWDWTAGVRTRVGSVAEERRAITKIEGTDLASLDRKRQLLDTARKHMGRLTLVGDLAAGAALVTAGTSRDAEHEEAALLAGEVASPRTADDAEVVHKARLRAMEWLAKDRPDDGLVREPVHWPLVFPEVFDQGGFDAVVGNPPFLGGQKLTGTLGQAYREYLVLAIGRGRRGSADLVAYFALRAHQLLNARGQTGLIATNTLAQGDTREVGLDQLTEDGIEIRRAVKSAPWPSKSAALEYCAVWSSAAPVAPEASRVLDDVAVRGITPSLDPKSRVSGKPYRLVSNRGRSFQGSNVLGKGFILTPDQADALLQRDPRNQDILFPYLNGEDLNTRPDCTASRWVINFHDWPEERARTYPDAFAIIERDVKPIRMANNRKVYRDYWWQYAEKRPAMVRAIADLDRILVVALVSRTVMPARVLARQVLAHKLAVFATNRSADLALLSSTFHTSWAWRYSSTMKADLNYSPSDIYETFPRPASTVRMEEAGDALDTTRRAIMIERQAGLTRLYHMIHDSSVLDSDIQTLREIHSSLDESVAESYDWTDLDLSHGFYETRQGVRFTVKPATRVEILDRLLELNHVRYARSANEVLPSVTTRPIARATTVSTPMENTIFNV